MKANPENDNAKESLRIDRLIAAYGEGEGAPGRAQWQALLALPEASPVTLLNFFKLRPRALYGAGSASAPCSGQEAFSRYAAVSAPGLEKVGGRFLLLAPFGATFVGEAEDWDFVAVGSYPDRNAVLELFENDDYRDAYEHRMAACGRQKVMFCPA